MGIQMAFMFENLEVYQKAVDLAEQIISLDATVKSPKNAAKTTPTLQNRGGKILLTLASVLPNNFPKDSIFLLTNSIEPPCLFR